MALTRHFTAFKLSSDLRTSRQIRSPWTLVSALEDILAALALKPGVANSTEAFFLDHSLEFF